MKDDGKFFGMSPSRRRGAISEMKAHERRRSCMLRSQRSGLDIVI